MAKCKFVQRKKTIICAGSMKDEIEIYERSLSAPLNPGGSEVNFLENFSLILTTWAMIDTPKGFVMFDEVTGSPTVIDTTFSIRYTDLLEGDTQRWVVFRSYRYRVMSVVNFENNYLFMQLNTTRKGAITNTASEV